MEAWKQSLVGAIRSLDQLLGQLGLEVCDLEPRRRAARDFPLRVPMEFVRRMSRGNPRDPLLLQVLPSADELGIRDGFSADPLGEHTLASAPGVLGKYRGRLLIVITGACAVNCRYCFRRHYPTEATSAGDWRAVVEEVASRTDCEEIILSGGDPLVLDDDLLAGLVAGLAALPHLRRLRIHSRLPVVIPSRVDDRLLAWLAGTRLQPVMVIHANHPQEIDDELGQAMARLRAAGISVLNQSVLLRGVNDSAPELVGLSTRLFDIGVLPYYLHLLDRVQGAAHFEVDEATAVELMTEVRAALPGYLVPRLVREVEGAASKVHIVPLQPGP